MNDREHCSRGWKSRQPVRRKEGVEKESGRKQSSTLLHGKKSPGWKEMEVKKKRGYIVTTDYTRTARGRTGQRSDRC